MYRTGADFEVKSHFLETQVTSGLLPCGTGTAVCSHLPSKNRETSPVFGQLWPNRTSA